MSRDLGPGAFRGSGQWVESGQSTPCRVVDTDQWSLPLMLTTSLSDRTAFEVRMSPTSLTKECHGVPTAIDFFHFLYILFVIYSSKAHRGGVSQPTSSILVLGYHKTLKSHLFESPDSFKDPNMPLDLIALYFEPMFLVSMFQIGGVILKKHSVYIIYSKAAWVTAIFSVNTWHYIVHYESGCGKEFTTS